MAFVVHYPKIDLRPGEALLGRLTVPAERSSIVLRHTPAGFIHTPKVVLRYGIALVSRRTVPANRHTIVLRDALAFVVHLSQAVLRGGMALLGRFAVPAGRSSIVLLRPDDADVVHKPKHVLSIGIALQRFCFLSRKKIRRRLLYRGSVYRSGFKLL